MAVMQSVGSHLLHHHHQHPLFLLHAQKNPLSHFRRRSITKSDGHRLLFLLRSWPLHARGPRQWGSNKDLNFDEEIEDFDDTMEQWFDVLEDYIDAIWIFKVFRSFGWTLPFIISSLLLATGPKAFLMAMALPLGQSTLTFALQRFQNRGKIESKLKKKTKKRRSRAYSSRNAKVEETEQWIRDKGARKRKKGYQSWVPKNDVSVRRSDRSKFGGWDELDASIESNVGFTESAAQKSNELQEKGKNRILSENDGPLLLRLLISIFPFLSSWTKVL